MSSEIPFVKHLGDAIKRSAAARIAGRRGRIRVGSPWLARLRDRRHGRRCCIGRV
jgi:hypothetical protein